jgi:hypothetical protein
MRFLFLSIFFYLSTGCFAQSLRDSLFGGKLKVDSALLISSKGNPQYSKPDSIKNTETGSEKKTQAVSEKQTQPVSGKQTKPVAVKQSASDTVNRSQPGTVQTTETDALQNQGNPEKTEIKYTDNPKIWKKFVDQYTVIMNTEVLPAKKIKKGTYTIMLDYEIGTDGVVGTKNITCMPENDYLVDQIKERMMPNAPQLAPLIRNGVPVKSGKRQMIILTKEKN